MATQASITLVNNRGNIGKTLSDLAKSDIIKSTIAAALTAGVMESIGGLQSMQGLQASDAFASKLTFNLINAGGRALTNVAINGGDLEDPLKQALVSGLVDTAHGAVASQIWTSGAWKSGQSNLLDACNTEAIDAGVASALTKSLGTM